MGPSLYPIVYGRTMGKDTGSTTVDVLVVPECEPDDPEFTSEQFQWLPSDFFVDQDGMVTLTSPHINKAHPVQHNGLYYVFPEILQRAVPMFERDLADLARPFLLLRIATSNRGWHREVIVDCLGERHSSSELFE